MKKNQLILSNNISDDLKFRLTNCGISCDFSGIVGYYSCGAMACSRCARRARARWLASAAEWMSRARPADLALVELVVAEVDRLDLIQTKIKRFRRDLRNLVSRWRRGGGFRSNSRLRGFCGIILYPSGWCVVARFVVDLAGAAGGPLADRLRRIWPSVKIQPVVDQPEAAAWCWPDFSSWSIEALNWLNSRRNLQILRISIQPKGAKRATGLSTRAGPRQHTVDGWAAEALPVIF